MFDNLLKQLLESAKDVAGFGLEANKIYSELYKLREELDLANTINSQKTDEFFSKLKENLNLIPTNAIPPMVAYVARRLESHSDKNKQYKTEYASADDLGAIVEAVATIENKENVAAFFDYCVCSKSHFDMHADSLQKKYEHFSDAMRTLRALLAKQKREIKFYEILIGIRVMTYDNSWDKTLKAIKTRIEETELPAIQTPEAIRNLRKSNQELRELHEKFIACKRMKHFEQQYQLDLGCLLQLKKYL